MSEPNVEVASTWWPEMENVWTPVGWKDHLFRFNVLFTGDIVAEPDPCLWFCKKQTSPYVGQGVQLTFIPAVNDTIPPAPGWSYAPIEHKDNYRLTDASGNRFGTQGWRDHATPVLWTEWRQPNPSLSGLVLKKEFFGHISGGKDVETGVEPLFGWIRLSVSKIHPKMHQEATVRYGVKPNGTPDDTPIITGRTCGFLIRLNCHHMYYSSYKQENLVVRPSVSAYPRALSAEIIGEGNKKGCLVLEPDDKVRLAAVPDQALSVKFIDRQEGTNDYYLYVELPIQTGAHVDLLLPMIPTDRAFVETEMALGFDKALQEGDEYWSVKPKTAAVVDTPESLINEAVKANMKMAELIAEKNPETGEYATLLGSLVFANAWATPTAMMFHMALDPLGYHDVVAKYLEIYKDHQGTLKPPGESYEKHPGYLSAPRSVASIDWLPDHGAILYSICRHALLTGDTSFIEEYLDTIIKGCEFIQDSLANTNHDGIKGILAPGTASDMGDSQQSVWTDGWNYKGLVSAVRVLKRINHPRAIEFEREAEQYKSTFQKALRERTEKLVEWTDSEGKSHHVVPMAMSGWWTGSEIGYIDVGPLFMVFSGLMDADDELMKSALLFFREGPNTETYNPQGQQLQPPVLQHEISIHEPCYSWNVYHSWQLGDRNRFLEGMYSLFAGGISRQTYISSESRHGESGLNCSFALACHLMRLAVVDDEIHEDELHLLRLCPLAWVKENYETKFENMPTELGPVTLKFRLSDDEKALLLTFEPKYRLKPKKAVLHVPPVPGLTQVIVNGREYKAKPGDTLILR